MTILTTVIGTSSAVGITGGVMAERLFGPPPLPPLLGDIMRGFIVASLIVAVSCAAYVIDRHRRVMTRPLRLMVWSMWLVCAGLLGLTVANALTIPPSPGVYPAVFLSLAAAGLALRAAVTSR